MTHDQGTLETRLDEFLFRYRLTPHATTGETPAVILMGRRPRSRLDLLHPDLGRRTREAQEQQRKDLDKSCRYRSVETGQAVFVRNFGRGPDWLSGVVENKTGPLSYRVSLPDGRLVRRHLDHVRPRATEAATRDGQTTADSRTRALEESSNIGVNPQQGEESRMTTTDNRPEADTDDVAERHPTEHRATPFRRIGTKSGSRYRASYSSAFNSGLETTGEAGLVV